VGIAYLAVDIGGTKLAAGVVNESGGIVVRDRVPTPPRHVWSAVERLVRRVQAASVGEDVVACGVACGGPMVPAQAGAVTVSPLHIEEWQDFPLTDGLAAVTGLPVFVDNDAKALALAEGWCGGAVGVDDYLAMVVATGVGGGLVSGGRLLSGRLGNAGHIGHVVVEPDGRPCACGGRGCLEAYASGRAIARETERPPARASQAIVERTGTLVGRAVASTLAVIDARLALVGGSVALGFGAPFFAAAQAELDRRVGLSFLQGAQIRPVGLGSMAPLIGAAALARQGYALRA
jgi:glucokinase